jgi:starch synthase
MPSLFEPCGLNQIYSLRYGTLPIVRATGGLDDTVDQYDEQTGEGTGFKFWQPTPRAVYDTVGWAVSTWYDRPAHIDRMRRNAMRKDFSWDRSIRAYEDLYDQALRVKFDYDHSSRLR